MNKLAKAIAAAGALVGGYVSGQEIARKREQEDELMAQKRELFNRMRDEYARQEAERQAAKETFGAIGKQTANDISSLAAKVGVPEDVLRQDIATFGPDAIYGAVNESTLAAKGLSPQEISNDLRPITQEDARQAYLTRMYSISPADALKRELGFTQADAEKLKFENEKRKASLNKELDALSKEFEGLDMTSMTPVKMQEMSKRVALIQSKMSGDPGALQKLTDSLNAMREQSKVLALKSLHTGDLESAIDYANLLATDKVKEIFDVKNGETNIGGFKVPTVFARVKTESGKEYIIDTAKEMFNLSAGVKDVAALRKLQAELVRIGQSSRNDEAHVKNVLLRAATKLSDGIPFANLTPDERAVWLLYGPKQEREKEKVVPDSTGGLNIYNPTTGTVTNVNPITNKTTTIPLPNAGVQQQLQMTPRHNDIIIKPKLHKNN